MPKHVIKLAVLSLTGIMILGVAGVMAIFHKPSQVPRTAHAAEQGSLLEASGEDLGLTDEDSNEQSALVRPQGTKLISVPILMYHHVGGLPLNADPIERDLTLSTEDFKQEVEWLKASGFTSITLEDIYKYSQGKFVMPAKPIIFTFDDGYADVFNNAVPILLQNGYKGSFAIITQFPGTTSGTNQYATWEQIVAAKKSGMEIVSHTQNHFDGSSPKYSSDFVYNNLLGAKEDLSSHGIETNVLIYPYGHYSQNYIEQAKKAGYVLGLTVRFGLQTDLDSLMEIPRVRVHGGEDLQRFEAILGGSLPGKRPANLQNESPVIKPRQ